MTELQLIAECCEQNIDVSDQYNAAISQYCKLYKIQKVAIVGYYNVDRKATSLAKHAKQVVYYDTNFSTSIDSKYNNIVVKRVSDYSDILKVDFSQYDLVVVDIDHRGSEMLLHRVLNDTYQGLAFYSGVNLPLMKDFWQHVGNEKLKLDWESINGTGVVYYPGKHYLNPNFGLEQICSLISDEMKKVDWLDELNTYNFSRIQHMRNHLSDPKDYSRHYYNALAIFCKIFKIKRVLEIGTEFGISSLAMAKYAEHIDTYDLDTTRLFDPKLLNHPKIKFHSGNAPDIIASTDLLTYDFIFMDISSYDAKYEQMLHKKLLEIEYEGIVWYDDVLTHRLNGWWNTIQNEKIVKQEFHVAGSGLVRYKKPIPNPVTLHNDGASLQAELKLEKLTWFGKMKRWVHNLWQ